MRKGQLSKPVPEGPRSGRKNSKHTSKIAQKVGVRQRRGRTSRISPRIRVSGLGRSGAMPLPSDPTEPFDLFARAQSELLLLQDEIDWKQVRPVWKRNASRWAKNVECLTQLADLPRVWKLTTELADHIKQECMVPAWHAADAPIASAWAAQTNPHDPTDVLRAIRMLRAHITDLPGGPIFTADGRALLASNDGSATDASAAAAVSIAHANSTAAQVTAAQAGSAGGSGGSGSSGGACNCGGGGASAPAARAISTQKVAQTVGQAHQECRIHPDCILASGHRDLCVFISGSERERARSVAAPAVPKRAASAPAATNVPKAAARSGPNPKRTAKPATAPAAAPSIAVAGAGGSQGAAAAPAAAPAAALASTAAAPVEPPAAASGSKQRCQQCAACLRVLAAAQPCGACDHCKRNSDTTRRGAKKIEVRRRACPGCPALFATLSRGAPCRAARAQGARPPGLGRTPSQAVRRDDTDERALSCLAAQCFEHTCHAEHSKYANVLVRQQRYAEGIGAYDAALAEGEAAPVCLMRHAESGRWIFSCGDSPCPSRAIPAPVVANAACRRELPRSDHATAH